MMDVKNSWNDQDFEEMGWHDARLYSVVMPDENFELTLDIDYIFKWEKSLNIINGFWVSPCDLTFSNVSNFKIEVDFKNTNLLSIINIERKNKRLTPNRLFTEWNYEIECDNGLIFFSATGFEQLVRKQPVLSKTQDLSRK